MNYLNNTRYLFYAITILFLVSSCSNDESEISSIDEELELKINTAPNSKGLNDLILPDADDFDMIPQDDANPITPAKVKLGQLLFNETAFSTAGEFEHLAGTYSCASCHHSKAGFASGNMQGVGEGGIGFGQHGENRRVDYLVEMNKIDVQPLRTPTALNIAYQTNVLWNGQFGATHLNIGTEDKWEEGPRATNKMGYQGVETQAIAGIEVHRIEFNEEDIARNGYKALFDEALPDLPADRRYSNEGAGLAIAAYERTLLSNQAPFQEWLRGNKEAMTLQEKEGAILFFGKGECTNCHYGPNLAGMEFHAIGLKEFDRSEVFFVVDDDSFKLGRGSFTDDPSDMYKFKVPQLYNLRDNPFYGHGASFDNVRDLIAYKNRAVKENNEVPNSQLSKYFRPLNLSEDEINKIALFIVNGLHDPDLSRYDPVAVLSNNCFPNNDNISKQDLGCN